MTNISAVDLNLLVVLDALLAERSVTAAGHRLGLSQPAVSNALARLRGVFDDPLLVRAGSGMEPTPRALELVDPVRHALSTISQVLAPHAPFDPLHSSHAFRISTAEDLELTLLPRLLHKLKRTAPSVELVVTPFSSAVAPELRSGRVDLYLGPWSSIPSSLEHHLLWQERFACIARKGHPSIKSRLSLKAYTEAGHVLVTPNERPGQVIDTMLSDQGYGRRVVLKTPHLLVAPWVVSHTDLIATIPMSAATALKEMLPLSVYRPPIDAPGFPVHMVWHPRTREHAPHRWLRQQMMEFAAADDGW